MKVRFGIDLGGTFIKAGIVTESHKILHQVRVPSQADLGREHVIKNIRKVYEILLERASGKRCELTAVGIGSPGTISQPRGVVSDASPNIRGWQGVVLTKVLGKIDVSIYADNDANCVALAEHVVGYRLLYHDMITLTVGTGIGGGLIIAGKLHRGNTFAGAEIGHMIIRHNGRKCRCGRNGCLEAYASVSNMMKRFRFWSINYKSRGNVDISPEKMYELFKQGNKAAVKTVKENADYLGAGLGSLVNILNPQAIVIGGGFSQAGVKYLDLVREAVARYAFRAATKDLKVLRARLGNKAGFIGAAMLPMVDEHGYISSRQS